MDLIPRTAVAGVLSSDRFRHCADIGPDSYYETFME